MANWTRRLTTTLILNDGRSVDTLAEAAMLVATTENMRLANWLHAVLLLKAAAEEGSHESIKAATVELRKTFATEGLMTMH